MNTIEESTPQFEIIIPIPDCFVASILKLSNGKNGHGESRLYIGDNNQINNYICQKQWKINYPENYKEEISELLDDQNSFSKICNNRKELVYQSIDECSDKMLEIVPQNGDKDVRRYYIGPNKSNDANKKLFNKFRATLIPKQFSIKLTEKETYFECFIIKNDVIEKKKKSKKSSNACKEFLTYTSNKYCIEIQDEDNKGEFALRNPKNGYFWPVDGYHKCEIHECNGNADSPCPFNNHVWEFQGDYFHGNPNKYSANDTFHGVDYSKKHDKDKEKKQYYEDNGYIVNIKWESEWVQEKKIMKQNNIQWN